MGGKILFSNRQIMYPILRDGVIYVKKISLRKINPCILAFKNANAILYLESR
jgi:hypothetical protein